MDTVLNSKKADLTSIEDVMNNMELGVEQEKKGLTVVEESPSNQAQEDTRIDISPKLEPCFPLSNTSNLYFGPKIIQAPPRSEEEKSQYPAGVPLPKGEDSTVSILDSRFYIDFDSIKIIRTADFDPKNPFKSLQLSLNYNSLVPCVWKVIWAHTETEFRQAIYPNQSTESFENAEEGQVKRNCLELPGKIGVNQELIIEDLEPYFNGLFRTDGRFLIRPPEPVADGLRSSFERKLVETWTRSNEEHPNTVRRGNLRLTVALPKPDRAPPPPRVWFPLILYLASEEICDGEKSSLKKAAQSFTVYIDVTTEESRKFDDISDSRDASEYDPNEEIPVKKVDFDIQHIKTRVTINGNNFALNPIFGYDSLVQKTLQSNTPPEDPGFVPIKHEILDSGLTECVICLEEKCNTAILPCRHLCLCYDCSIELNTQTRRCPICRQDVDALLHIDIHEAAGVGAFSNVSAQICK